MGETPGMGNVQNPHGLQGDAAEASAGIGQACREEDYTGLWAQLTQVAGHPPPRNPNIWYQNDLTSASCIRYRVRAEGGQGFLKGAPAPSSQRGPRGQNGVEDESD